MGKKVSHLPTPANTSQCLPTPPNTSQHPASSGGCSEVLLNVFVGFIKQLCFMCVHRSFVSCSMQSCNLAQHFRSLWQLGVQFYFLLSRSFFRSPRLGVHESIVFFCPSPSSSHSSRVKWSRNAAAYRLSTVKYKRRDFFCVTS